MHIFDLQHIEIATETETEVKGGYSYYPGPAIGEYVVSQPSFQDILKKYADIYRLVPANDS
jgi:hypothetical protein